MSELAPDEWTIDGSVTMKTLTISQYPLFSGRHGNVPLAKRKLLIRRAVQSAGDFVLEGK
jgi:hypothetical protein